MQNDYDPFNLEPENDNAELKEKDKLAAQQEIDDFLWLMRDKRGRRIMWRMLTWTHVFKTSFTGRRNDTDFQEGERNIGCRLINEIHTHCPELYPAMVKEQKNG